MLGFPSGSAVKNPLAVQETQERWVWSLGWDDTLGEGMETHSSILAWRIPWTEEPGGLSPQGHKESDTTEWLSTHAQMLMPGLNAFFLFAFHFGKSSFKFTDSSLSHV